MEAEEGQALAFGCWAVPCDSVEVELNSSEDGVELLWSGETPLGEEMPHCGICDFWRFPLNLLLRADSLLLSILPLLWGFWGCRG